MAKPIKLTASMAQERSWRDRYTLHILLASLALAALVGGGLYVYWRQLTALAQ